MSQMIGIVENDVYINERVIDLDKILEENKNDLSLYNIVAHIDDKEYVIDYAEEYTTKIGIKLSFMRLAHKLPCNFMV